MLSIAVIIQAKSVTPIFSAITIFRTESKYPSFIISSNALRLCSSIAFNTYDTRSLGSFDSRFMSSFIAIWCKSSDKNVAMHQGLA